MRTTEPILTLLAFRSWGDPLLTLCVLVITAMFAVFLWGMFKIERQLNDEGQSLFYPWRVPSPKQKGLRVDNALRHALQALANCEPTVIIAWRLELRTKSGKLVPEAARGSYDRAVARLENATGLEPDERWRVLDEAERRPTSREETERLRRAREDSTKWLWAARAEVLREMVR